MTDAHPRHHGIREIIIEPSKLIWGAISLILAAILVLVALKADLTLPESVLHELILAAVLLFCITQLLPLCHSILLDAHGVTFNHFFKSTFYSWKVIHSIEAITDDESWFPSRVAIFFSAPKSDFLFGKPARGDLNISVYYALTKTELASAMTQYKKKNIQKTIPLNAAEQTMDVYKDKQFAWGRSGDGKERALQQLTLWERLYRWRNP